jgi:hypothetical protein
VPPVRGCLLVLLAVTMIRAQQTSEPAAKQGTTAAQRAVEEVLEIKRQYDETPLCGDSDWFERAFADDYLLILGDVSVDGKHGTAQLAYPCLKQTNER